MTGAVHAQLSADARACFDDAATRADAALATMSGCEPESRLYVPGRIEVLGKHTDYAGGESLTCAVERGFSVSYVPTASPEVRMVDARDGRRVDFPIAADLAPTVGHWTNYPMTVARRLVRDFGPLPRGADIGFHSTLPKAAGLSTSSALIVAMYLVLARVNDLEARPAFRRAIETRAALAGYLGSVENGQPFGLLGGDHGVGTFGGSEDHTAILLSEAGRLTCYRYAPVTPLRQIALSEELTFVVAASGIAADKTGGARGRYNRAASLVGEILGQWNAATGRADRSLADALASSPEAIATLRTLLAAPDAPGVSSDLKKRLEHYLLEDLQLLPAALEALIAGRLDGFGALVDRSQRAAEELLRNQVPETLTLARLARHLGAHAASSFGAGFGGSVWALVDAVSSEHFRHRWLDAYAAVHPDAAQKSTSFVTRPGPGAGSTT